jgi:hypothetical protein
MKLHRRKKIMGTAAKTKSCSDAAGFTLMETVISLPIAAIVLVALYACFAQGFNLVSQERETLRSTQILLKQVERIRLSSFDQLTNTVYNPSTLTDYYNPSGQQSGNGGAAYAITFTPRIPASGTMPDSYRNNMLLITVGITWNSGGLQHTNWIQTFAARNGIESFVAAGQQASN